jgi:hypothetical protein
LMNEKNKSFYPLDMLEFIHHPEYGCRDLKGLILNVLTIFFCIEHPSKGTLIFPHRNILNQSRPP